MRRLRVDLGKSTTREAQLASHLNVWTSHLSIVVAGKLCFMGYIIEFPYTIDFTAPSFSKHLDLGD